MRRWRTSLARLSAVAMLASLLALVGGSPAQADPIPTTNWTPVTIGSDLPAASTVLTDAADGVGVLTHVSVGVRPDVSVPAGGSWHGSGVRGE